MLLPSAYLSLNAVFFPSRCHLPAVLLPAPPSSPPPRSRDSGCTWCGWSRWCSTATDCTAAGAGRSSRSEDGAASGCSRDDRPAGSLNLSAMAAARRRGRCGLRCARRCGGVDLPWRCMTAAGGIRRMRSSVWVLAQAGLSNHRWHRRRSCYEWNAKVREQRGSNWTRVSFFIHWSRYLYKSKGRENSPSK